MTIQVPGYTVQKLLGEGGMASVYLATQKSLDRLVALKILKKFDTDAQIQRFFNEGKIIASLNQRNIITIHDLGEINGQCFLAMEYLEGGDLKQRLNNGLPPDEAIRLIKLIAHCLAFVHQKDIIHRDIKPENILFRKDGSPVITDFGVAKQLQTDASLTMDGSAIGSPHYISPEQAEQKSLDSRTDIYSLGIIFYEMLTGQKPFQGDSAIEIIIAHLTTEAAPLPHKLARYQELLDLMIAKNADDRFESAAELANYLEKMQNSASRRALSNQFRKIVSTAETTINPPVMTPSSATSPKKSFLNNPYGIVLALLIALSATAYLNPESQTKLASPNNALTLSTADDVTSIPDKQNKILQLLAKAEIILAERNISLPTLQQAYDDYHHVLELDSKNARAIQGINRVTVLNANIQDAIDLNLLAANKALQSFRLTSPANNNAMFYFHTVLLLDPNNSEALQGNLKVANVYADLVEANLKDFNYSKAKIHLDKGLSINPTSSRLLALKDQTNAFTDAPTRLFGKVKSIFD